MLPVSNVPARVESALFKLPPATTPLSTDKRCTPVTIQAVARRRREVGHLHKPASTALSRQPELMSETGHRHRTSGWRRQILHQSRVQVTPEHQSAFDTPSTGLASTECRRTRQNRKLFDRKPLTRTGVPRQHIIRASTQLQTDIVKMMSEAQADSQVMRSGPLNKKTTPHIDVARECFIHLQTHNAMTIVRSPSGNFFTVPRCTKESPNTPRNDNRALAIGTPVIHKGHSFRQLSVHKALACPEGQICKVLHKKQLGYSFEPIEERSAQGIFTS